MSASATSGVDPDCSAAEAAIAVGLPAIDAESVSALVLAALRAVIDHGHPVSGTRSSRELLNQQLCLTDPCRRVLHLPGSSFNPAVAVARLVWHLAGNSRLDAIEFYEPRARLFSDDGEVLPGSNTGARLFGVEGGVDQVAGIVARLRSDPSSRRATAVVWRPEDAVRESRDIPCAISFGCHLRNGELIATVNMRSNNALRLLPYNAFEFTMLAELVAAELDVGLGPYWHCASSLHVFEDELERARGLASLPAAATAVTTPMPPMPRDGRALEGAVKLVECEATLRAAAVSGDREAIAIAVATAERELPDYWLSLFCVLALFADARAGAVIDTATLLDRMPLALREPITADLSR